MRYYYSSIKITTCDNVRTKQINNNKRDMRTINNVIIIYLTCKTRKRTVPINIIIPIFTDRRD